MVAGRTLIGCATLLVGLLGSAAVIAADEDDTRFEAARAMIERGQFPAARDALARLADDGHLGSQAALAAMTLKGLGGARSVHNAMGWYCRLAQQPAGGREVAHALWFLAEYHRTGGAVPGSEYGDGDPAHENPIKALFWFRILAGQQRYYHEVVDEAVSIGRLGAAAMARQLYPSEVAQVDLRLADWRPDPASMTLRAASRCRDVALRCPQRVLRDGGTFLRGAAGCAS